MSKQTECNSQPTYFFQLYQYLIKKIMFIAKLKVKYSVIMLRLGKNRISILYLKKCMQNQNVRHV